MRLSFLNRENEFRRLKRAITAPQGSFCCLYGRRRCGKSRLLRQLLPEGRSVYYVGDRREAGLQRTALAEAVGLLLPGFDDVAYPDWLALLKRWWNEAPPGGVLSLDEFPYLVDVSPELPSLLQKLVDENAEKPLHLILSGSSQRMMQGLVLDESEPLYGRAREIIHVRPLGAAWLQRAFGTDSADELVADYAVWGGIPRYWELATDFGALWDAVESLVFDPLGVLHQEPGRLLNDDMRDTVQASSILAVVGRGCHRLSEIAGRLGKPATSLTRPIRRLLQLGLLRRDVPFGHSPESSKSTVYSIADPFLMFWFRFVDPNRSRLGAGALDSVTQEVQKVFPIHKGAVWEQLVRTAIPRLALGEMIWGPASRWWGPGIDHRPMEIDVVAESEDRRSLLVGEVKLSVSSTDIPRIETDLVNKARRLPFLGTSVSILPFVFSVNQDPHVPAGNRAVTAEQVLSALT